MADNMGNMTITSANSILYISVPGLYDAPTRIEQFGTDQMLSVAQNNPVIAEKGVDGHTSFGWVPTNKEITITLAADSPSLRIFEDWANYQDSVREVMVCNAEFTIPSINRKIIGTRGAMTTSQAHPSAAQTLQASTFTLTFDKWESTVI